MGFSGKQVRALRRCPDHRHIRTREVHGRELTYLEGWYAISEANRIFGFDGWSRETVESRAVLARENRGTFLAVYIARVRVTVQPDGMAIVREGHGSGEGRGTSPGARGRTESAGRTATGADSTCPIGADRQERPAAGRAQANARQSAPEIRRFAALPCLWTAAIRPAPSALRPAERNRYEGQR
jgi:hypothetical protein